MKEQPKEQERVRERERETDREREKKEQTADRDGTLRREEKRNRYIAYRIEGR